MKKLALALAPVIALLATAPAAMAEKISLNNISSYLNGLSTVQSEFTQVNPDGTIEGLVARYPKTVVRDFDGNPNKLSEMDALVAYLQMLGTLVDFSTYDDKANLR